MRKGTGRPRHAGDREVLAGGPHRWEVPMSTKQENGEGAGKATVDPLRVPAGPVTLKLVQQLLEPFNGKYGPTIDLAQAAELGGYEPGTVYKLVSQGFFSRSVSRTRPLLFLRDLFVWERMNIAATRRAKRRAKSVPTTEGVER